MYSLEWFRGKKITVMGLGIHGGGLGVAKWLRRHGARVTVTDLRDQHALASSIDELERTYLQELRRIGKANMHRITYVLGKHPEELFTGADMVIQNPAVPRDNAYLALARANKVPIETDISLFFLLCPFPIAAVSGTKGKTTTTTLLADICRRFDKRTVIGGNIRVSPLDRLDALLAAAAKRNAHPIPIVLELSSWQLEGLKPHKISPHVGVLTMIAEDHLNRYDGMADYASAKEINVAYQKDGDVAVLDADNTWTRAIGNGKGPLKAGANKGMKIWYSVKPLPAKAEGCCIVGGKIVAQDGGKRTVICPVSAVAILGAHNLSNVLAATAAAYAMGMPLSIIREAIKAFTGVPYRLETIATKRGIRFVDDTAATAPDASIAAMAAFTSQGARGAAKKNIILISGGADKSLDFGPWAAAVKKSAVKHLVLFDGSATPKMEAALAAVRANVPIAGARSMREAFAEAMRHAVKGDVVLLSPGCASFGVFKNEFDRGDQFNAAVRRLR